MPTPSAPWPVPDAAPTMTMDLGERTVPHPGDDHQAFVPACPPLAWNDVDGWANHLHRALEAPPVSLHGMPIDVIRRLDQNLTESVRTASPKNLEDMLRSVLRRNVWLKPHHPRADQCSAGVQEALVGWLLARGASVGRTVVEEAATAVNPRLLQRMLNRSPQTPSRFLRENYLLFHVARSRPWGAAEVVIDTLVAHGQALNDQDPEGRTPLFAAVETTNPTMVLALLNRGADPEAKTSGGETPLLNACRRNRWIMVAPLLAAGADPHRWTTLGSLTCPQLTCPLQETVTSGAVEVLEELLRRDVEFFPRVDPNDPTSPRDPHWLNLAREQARSTPTPEHQRCLEHLDNVWLRLALRAEIVVDPSRPSPRRARL